MLPPPPPIDRDVIMGPPPVPPFTPSSAHNSKDPTREYSEKYYKLKRKYWELEEVRFFPHIPASSFPLTHRCPYRRQ